MDKKSLIIGGVTVLVCLLIGFYLGSSSVKGLLGGTTAATWTAANLVSQGTLDVAGVSTLAGANTLSGVNTLSGATTTISGYACIKIPIVGSATTLYLLASTTANAAGNTTYYPLLATSTKPTYCP